MIAKRYPILLALLALIATVSAQSNGSSGAVVATMDAEGYTYAQIEIDGSKVWFAAPSVEIKVGDLVATPTGMPMKDFHSKSLDRTFDMIYFVDSITPSSGPATAATLPSGHPPITATASSTAAGFDFSGIEKPEGAKTVAEIHQESAALAGQNVIIRGIAVKVSNGIMGKNWVHLQDGTSEFDANDLTVTSTNTVEVGATVTASGILATNLDFGYGYTYAVLLQDAAITAK